MIDKMN